MRCPRIFLVVIVAFKVLFLSTVSAVKSNHGFREEMVTSVLFDKI